MTGATDRPDRREAIRTGLAAGIGVLIGRLPLAAVGGALEEQGLPPVTRPIPSTGERLPVVGLSTVRFNVTGARQVTPLCAALRKFAELEGKVLDTARTYGRAEEVLGQCVKEIGGRDRFFISTRFSVTPSRGRGRGGADAMKGLELAFTRLGVERIDLFMVNNVTSAKILLPHLHELKQAGRIRYLGVCASTSAQFDPLIGLMEREKLDVIEVDYSVGNRTAAQYVLPLAARNRVGVLVNAPLDARGVSILPRFAGRALPDFAGQVDAKSWAQLLLKYVIAHPAVTAVLPTATRAAQVIEYNGAGRGRLPDPNMRDAIEQLSRFV